MFPRLKDVLPDVARKYTLKRLRETEQRLADLSHEEARGISTIPAGVLRADLEAELARLRAELQEE